jgi:hypothetical protein
MKKFSLLESFKYSDEEIEDFFMDYVDEKKFTLVSGFLTKDDRFFTDVANTNKTTRKCKMVTIELEDVANGIQKPGGGRSLNSFETIDKILSEIKKFYARSGESPNFSIETRWEDITITFFIVGGLVEETDTNIQDNIIKFQKELLQICKNRGYKRVSLKNNNWCEIRTPVRDPYNIYYGTINIFNQLRDGNLPVNDRNQPLIDWYQRLTTAGLTIDRRGGDQQIVIKLRKI